MNVIFVDTSGWFATAARKDYDHPAARRFFEANRLPLLTTDYVVDETVTLFQARLDHNAAIRFLDSIQASSRVQLYFLAQDDIERAMQLFRDRPDKGWSLTDCASFTLMGNLGIATAFTFDEHFRQAGFQVVP